jgi:chromate transport protein ChrA
MHEELRRPCLQDRVSNVSEILQKVGTSELRDLRARCLIAALGTGIGGSVALDVGFVVAPILARHRDNANVQGFVKGAYAATIGTILGACILLGKIAIGDWLTVAIGVVSLAVLFRWKVSNPLLIGLTAVVGLIAFPLLQPEWVMVK